MGDIVKLSWSGGKDSTAAALLHLERGNRLIMVNYIPMFTRDIPLLHSDHYKFLLDAADYFESRGCVVIFVHGETYVDHVRKITTRGKNKGLPHGFPYAGKFCAFASDSKIKALNSVTLGGYDYQDVGIAADEVRRLGQLNKHKRSILAENNITEAQAHMICEKYGLLSPVYERLTRDGCVLCHNGSEKERLRWFAEYPEAWEILHRLEIEMHQRRPDRPPLRNHKYFTI